MAAFSLQTPLWAQLCKEIYNDSHFKKSIDCDFSSVHFIHISKENL